MIVDMGAYEFAECQGDAECNDEDPCNGIESCVLGACHPGSIQDCNNNGVDDVCDIIECAPGDSTCKDCNANGLPDGCESNVLNALINREPFGSYKGSDQTGGTLCRSANNFAKFTFACDLSQVPTTGQVQIREMLPGEMYGTDVSASFTFSIVNDAQGRPRILRIDENGSVLTIPADRRWFAVRHVDQNWSGQADFLVQYLVMVGDADGSARVLGLDVSLINANISPLLQPDHRCDIDGNGRVLGLDVSIANSKISPLTVPKPSGH